MNVIYLDDIKHGVRVANYSSEIAKQLHFSQQTIESIYISGLLHDVGKAYLNQDILNKNGVLTHVERKMIEQHSMHSYNEILNMGYHKEVALNVLHHHENWNGTGYPNKLKGIDIPLCSRILKLADVFDALTMERPYRKKMNIEEALKTMENEKLTYDPELYLIFIRYIKTKYINSRECCL